MNFRWLRRLLLPGLGLLIAEIILRAAGYPLWTRLGDGVEAKEYEGDPLCGWRLKQGVFDLAAFGRIVRMTNWPEGMRATRDARDGQSLPLLLLLGDSYAAGYGLSDKETFAWLLQQQHPELDVRNLGTPGYGTVQSYLAMKRYLHEPRPLGARVVYVFNHFHESRNVGEPAWYRVMKEPPARYHFPYLGLSRNGSLKFLDSGGLVPWRLSGYFSTVALLNEVVDAARFRSRLDDARPVTEQVLLEMQASAASRGAEFVVVFLAFDAQAFSQYASFLKGHSIKYADCRIVELGEPQFRLEDGHPNAEGNKLIGACIERLLLR